MFRYSFMKKVICLRDSCSEGLRAALISDMGHMCISATRLSWPCHRQRGYMNSLFLPESLISYNTAIWHTVFMAPCHALLCGWVSVLWVIYGHANEDVCLGRCAAFAQWALERRLRLRGCESVPNCWHRHRAGRDSQSKMGRWPSQVLTLTDEIKEKVGQARQVSGKQTPRDRVKETNTPRSQIELGEWKVAG